MKESDAQILKRFKYVPHLCRPGTNAALEVKSEEPERPNKKRLENIRCSLKRANVVVENPLRNHDDVWRFLEACVGSGNDELWSSRGVKREDALELLERHKLIEDSAEEEKPIDIFAAHGIDPKDGCDFAKPRIDVSNALSSPIGDPAVKEVFRWWRSKIWNARKQGFSQTKWTPRDEGILFHPSTELVDCAQNRDVALRVLREHGYEKGLPDLILISPQCGGPGFRIRLGLALEIKKNGDKLSLEQDWMLKRFERNWFVSKIAHGADHAIAIIEAYMKGEDELA